MAPGAVKGKALVAKLRGTPGVRNAEALAAWIGRKNKKLKGPPSLKGSKGSSDKGKKIASKGSDATRPAGKSKPKTPAPNTRRNTTGETSAFSGARAKSEKATKNDEIRSDRLANLKRGDKAIVNSDGGTERATVLGKTRDGKIKVQPERGREKTVDPLDVSPETRDGKTLNPRGSLEGQKPGDPGYRGKNDSKPTPSDKGRKLAGKSGAKDPAKATDEELDSMIQFAAMAVDKGLPTQEQRRKMAIRYQDLLAEKKKRREKKALGYDYSPKRKK